MKYRKKPVVVEVFHLEDLSYKMVKGALKFMGQWKEFKDSIQEKKFDDYMWGVVLKENGIIIKTLEGNHLASPGDYIIKGVAGEFYPCKPDIFARTYEKVEV